jgi:hypothetical protein
VRTYHPSLPPSLETPLRVFLPEPIHAKLFR